MYRLSELAAEDFAASYKYTLLNFGVRQADAYPDDLESVFNLLLSSPLMGDECQEIAADSPSRSSAARYFLSEP